MIFRLFFLYNNLLLIECEGCVGDYWPEVRTKMSEGRNCPLGLSQTRLERPLVYMALGPQHRWKQSFGLLRYRKVFYNISALFQSHSPSIKIKQSRQLTHQANCAYTKGFHSNLHRVKLVIFEIYNVKRFIDCKETTYGSFLAILL